MGYTPDTAVTRDRREMHKGCGMPMDRRKGKRYTASTRGGWVGGGTIAMECDRFAKKSGSQLLRALSLR